MRKSRKISLIFSMTCLLILLSTISFAVENLAVENRFYYLQLDYDLGEITLIDSKLIQSLSSKVPY